MYQIKINKQNIKLNFFDIDNHLLDKIQVIVKDSTHLTIGKIKRLSLQGLGHSHVFRRTNI